MSDIEIPSRREVHHEPTPKAGRDLRSAIITGVVLVAIIVATLAIDARLFLLVLLAAILIGAMELVDAVRRAALHVSIVPVAIGTVGMILSAYLRGPEALAVTYALTVFGVILWRAADGLAGSANDVAASALVALYPCFIGGFVALMLAEPQGRLRVVLFIALTVASDTGGYAMGVLFGKHPMAPSLSPKKSWEGFAGSLLAAAIVGAIALPLMLDGAIWAGALIGVAAAIGATLGDLIESSIKRDLGMKDMSRLLPGHGGFMDRLDSLLIVAPIVWAMLLWAVPAA